MVQDAQPVKQNFLISLSFSDIHALVALRDNDIEELITNCMQSLSVMKYERRQKNFWWFRYNFHHASNFRISICGMTYRQM
jgi:hypothetical protein